MADLQDLPLKCHINHTGDEKYVVAKITPRGYPDPDHGSAYVAVVSFPLEYHSMIVDQFQEELGAGFQIDVYGGGIIVLDAASKHIHTFGQSGGFGRPNRDLVEKILKFCYPDWTLDVTVTSHIRG